MKRDIDQYITIGSDIPCGYELEDPAVLTERWVARNSGPNRHERRRAASIARKAKK